MRPKTVSPYVTFTLTIIFLALAVGTLTFMILTNRETTAVAPAYAVDGGSADQGPDAIQRYGCGSCHSIPGVNGAVGVVGPSLEHFGSRSFIAGHFPNVPDNLVAGITQPQQLLPGNAMPDMDVSNASARDIAAYLYTLK